MSVEEEPVVVIAGTALRYDRRIGNAFTYVNSYLPFVRYVGTERYLASSHSSRIFLRRFIR